MTHLLDTKAVLDLLALPAGTTTNLPADAIVHISVITQVEINYGIASAVDAQTSLARPVALQQVLGTWKPLPIDGAVASVFLGVARGALLAGQKPWNRMNDLMIAATAVSRRWTLVTGDETLVRAVEAITPVVTLR